MASTIQLKRGSGAPTAGDLAQGEPALDLTNKRLYTEDSGGSVIEVGTNPSSLSIDGTAVTATAAELNILDGVTATTVELNYLDVTTLGTVEASKVVTAASNGNVRFPDTERLTFGASNDLSIFHDGSNSYIDDSGTGNLLIRADDSITLKSFSGTGVKYLEAVNGGEVRAYHNNNLKFSTKSTGITVTGTVIADGVSLGDNEKAQFGASNDLEIYHDGSNSYIEETGTGSLIVKTDGAGVVFRDSSNINLLSLLTSGEVKLFWSGGGVNAEKLTTNTNGISVNGFTETDKFRLTNSNVPATSSSSGTAGDIAIDTNYIYVCVNTNVWKRVAIDETSW